MADTGGIESDPFSGDGEDELLFSWGIRRLRRWSLILFVTISLALHAFGFYLFRAATPPARNLPPLPATVVILSQEDPAARALIERLDTRLPGFKGSVGKMAPALGVATYVRGFSPSFAGREPGFIDPAGSDGVSKSSDLPALVGGVDTLLPPVVVTSSSASVAASVVRSPSPPVVLSVDGGISLVENPRSGIPWEGILEKSDLPFVRCFVVVSDEGGVVVALPAEELPVEVLAEVGAAARNLRFAPRDPLAIPGPQRSGWLEVGWELEGDGDGEGGGE